MPNLHKPRESADHAESLQLLREANAQLDRFLACFSGSETSGSIGDLQLLLELHDLLERITPLFQAGGLQASADARVHVELAAYSRNLLRLRSELAATRASAESSGLPSLATGKRKSPFPPPRTASSYEC